MVEELRKLLSCSKPVLSNYSVACIIECKNGNFKGVNIETSSPSAGVCAERNALYNLLANGLSGDDIIRINIMNKTDKECYPCFICRQALVDFCNSDTIIRTYNYSGEFHEIRVGDLCPYPFDSENIK